jgi:hypothetical protein
MTANYETSSISAEAAQAIQNAAEVFLKVVRPLVGTAVRNPQQNAQAIMSVALEAVISGQMVNAAMRAKPGSDRGGMLVEHSVAGVGLGVAGGLNLGELPPDDQAVLLKALMAAIAASLSYYAENGVPPGATRN